MATIATSTTQAQASAKDDASDGRPGKVIGVCVSLLLVVLLAVWKLGVVGGNNLRGGGTASGDYGYIPPTGWTPDWSSEDHSPVSVPLFHLARKVGLGVFMEAELGGQYVTMLLDSGSTALAVLGPDSEPDVELITQGYCPQSSFRTALTNIRFTQGPLPQCSVADFHNRTMRSRCSLGSYDVKKAFGSVEIWPTPGSEFCEHSTDGGMCVAASLYGDGSCFLALMFKDKLSVGHFSQHVPVQSIVKMAGIFQEAPSSGIIGMAAKELNCANYSDPDSCYPGAMQQLLLSQGVDRKIGLCLGRPPLPDNQTNGYLDYGTPGLMTLGGIQEELANGSMHYTKISDHSGRYSVNMLSVGFNGQLVSNNATDFKTTIVDTGAQVLGLPSMTLNALKEAAQKTECQVDADCRLNLQLEGVCLDLVGVMACEVGPKHCSLDNRSVSQSETAIIGYAALKDLYLELNLEDFQVGFAARSNQSCNARCSSFLSEATCSFAENCKWLMGQCTGGMSTGGSTSRGSRAAGTCFAGQVSNTQNLTEKKPDDDNITQNLTSDD